MPNPDPARRQHPPRRQINSRSSGNTWLQDIAYREQRNDLEHKPKTGWYFLVVSLARGERMGKRPSIAVADGLILPHLPIALAREAGLAFIQQDAVKGVTGRAEASAGESRFPCLLDLADDAARARFGIFP